MRSDVDTTPRMWALSSLEVLKSATSQAMPFNTCQKDTKVLRDMRLTFTPEENLWRTKLTLGIISDGLDEKSTVTYRPPRKPYPYAAYTVR